MLNVIKVPITELSCKGLFLNKILDQDSNPIKQSE
nr:MAG TPA: hypothetical protein [Caudoviricetes sp.]